MRKQRILIIDDESSFTWILKLNLERTGRYEVRTESAGQRGVAAAREFHPDLVLLDVIMPDLDGGTVAAQLKEDPEVGQVPVVFLTATVGKEEAAAHGGFIGGQHFLAKPVTLESVVTCLEHHLGTPKE